MRIQIGVIVILSFVLDCQGVHKSRKALLEDTKQRLDRIEAAQACRQIQPMDGLFFNRAAPFDPVALSKVRQTDSDLFGYVSTRCHESWDGGKSSSSSGSSSDSPVTPDFKLFVVSLRSSRPQHLSVTTFATNVTVGDQKPCTKIDRIAQATNQLRLAITDAGYDLDESPSRRPGSPAEAVIHDLHHMRNVVQLAKSIEDSEEEAEVRRVLANRWVGEGDAGIVHELHKIEGKIPCLYLKAGMETFKFGLICMTVGGVLAHICHKKYST